MRDYAKAGIGFWQGDLARGIRGDSIAISVAYYLITAPMSNMIGIYHLKLGYIATDTGLPLGSPFEAPSKPAAKVVAKGSLTIYEALRKLEQLDYVRVDFEHEVVWVVKAVEHEFPQPLSPKDNQVKAIRKLVKNLEKSPFYKPFLERYARHLAIEDMLCDLGSASPDHDSSGPLRSPFEATSKPLRSQDPDPEPEPEPETEPKPERKARVRDAPASTPVEKVVPIPPLPAEIDTPEIRVRWKEWCEHQAERKKGMGPTRVKRHFDDLKRVAAINGLALVEECLARAVASEWSGVAFKEHWTPGYSSDRRNGRQAVPLYTEQKIMPFGPIDYEEQDGPQRVYKVLS